MHELYIERKVDGQDAVYQETLIQGTEAECRSELKNCIEAIRTAGFLVNDKPDIQPLVQGISRYTQFVATRLGTIDETHTLFCVGRA